MKDLLSRFVLGVIAATTTSGCYGTSDYQGDGSLVDLGPSEARHRYILTVVEVNLGKAGYFEFDVSGLPQEEFFVGFEIPLLEGPLKGDPKTYLPCDPHVQIRIIDRTEEEYVFGVGGRIASDWTWSVARGDLSAFVYMRTREGMGFNPSADREYTLKLQVNHLTGEACQIRAILTAKSSGWK